MAIGFNLAQPHRVVAANSHYYKTPKMCIRDRYRSTQKVTAQPSLGARKRCASANFPLIK